MEKKLPTTIENWVWKSIDLWPEIAKETWLNWVLLFKKCVLSKGKAGATYETKERGGGDAEAAGETKGDWTESPAKIQRLAAKEEPRKTWKGKEGEGHICSLVLFFQNLLKIVVTLLHFLEQMEAALKEEQDRERRRKAEEKFKEWLTTANEKTRASPTSRSCPTSKIVLVTWITNWEILIYIRCVQYVIIKCELYIFCYWCRFLWFNNCNGLFFT